MLKTIRYVCHLLFIGLLQILSMSQPLLGDTSSLPLSSTPGIVWEHKVGFDDFLIPPDSSCTHLYLTVRMRSACAVACNLHQWCASFFYEPREGMCLLDSVLVKSLTDAQMAPGVVHFYASSAWCSESEGFIFYPSEQFCFRVYQEVVTDWVTAHSRCKSLGLELVAPANKNQMSLLLSTVERTKEFRRKNSYLGIIRPLDEWNTAWLDGVPRFVDVYNRTVGLDVLQKDFWVKNNPNNQKNQQNCIQIDRKRGNKLNDLWCDYNNYYICQRMLSNNDDNHHNQ